MDFSKYRNHQKFDLNNFMKIKNFLYKLKTDLKGVYNYPSIYTNKTDYELYWKNKSSELNAFQRDRAKIVEKRIREYSSVVDVASGTGKILNYLILRKKIKAKAFDLSKISLKRHQDLNIECFSTDLNNSSDLEQLPEANHYLAFEILEHLQNSEAVLHSLLKKANQSVFVSVPNTGYFTYRLRLMLGRFPVQWRNHPGEHIRFWTKEDMTWWLKELNLKSQSKLYFYQGIPLLNKMLPGIFAKGILVEIQSAMKLQ